MEKKSNFNTSHFPKETKCHESDFPSVLQHFHKAIAKSKQDTSTWDVPVWHKILDIGIGYRFVSKY